MANADLNPYTTPLAGLPPAGVLMPLDVPDDADAARSATKEAGPPTRELDDADPFGWFCTYEDELGLEPALLLELDGKPFPTGFDGTAEEMTSGPLLLGLPPLLDPPPAPLPIGGGI